MNRTALIAFIARRNLTALLVGCSTLFATSSARAQWSVINLHPAAAAESQALGIRNGIEVGWVDSAPGTTSIQPALWTGTAASYVNLGGWQNAGGRVLGTDGVQHVGGSGGAATLWTSTPGSVVSLQPPAPPNYSTFVADANGVFAGMQAGAALFITQNAGPNYQEAGIWNDTAGSWQSLHPAGATNSQANDTHFGQQAGWAYLPNAQNPVLPAVQHAALWYSSAASFVDLHPAGALQSIANDVFVTGGLSQQVGFARFAALPEAAMWTGTAASFVNMHPLTAAASELLGNYAGYQAGFASFFSPKANANLDHAGLWSGTAASFLDLHAFLPTGFSRSRAEDVWVANNGDIWVAGWAVNASTGLSEAMLWTTHQVPEPAGATLLATVAVGMTSLMRRRSPRFV
ncbi:hypothetical protein [Lacipirellula sp.]|uniref:hypothetical protein n=1 Tax=Lacipirellula sp. TaxID=2691419 RepID=UPI003D0A74B8